MRIDICGLQEVRWYLEILQPNVQIIVHNGAGGVPKLFWGVGYGWGPVSYSVRVLTLLPHMVLFKCRNVPALFGVLHHVD